MTTNHHTPIPSSPQQPANASTINSPLGELDAAITGHETRIGDLEAEMPVPSGSPTEYLDGEGNWTVPAGTGAGVDGHEIQDEGVPLPQRAVINFVGAGVTVTNETGGTQVEIPGGGVTDHGALTGLNDDDHPQYVLGITLASKLDTIIKGMQLVWNSSNSLSVGIGACYAENGDYINITSALTASSLSLSNSTWYHIYVYLSSGSPAVEVVTTAPAAWKSTAYSKTGDTSRRYVGSVITDGSGNIYKFLHDPNLNAIYYKKFAGSSAPFRCLSGGVANTATAVALSGIIPITAELASVRISNTADAILRVSDDNGVDTTQATLALIAGNTSAQYGFVLHPTDASQQIWYKFASTPSIGNGNVDVLGYYFKR